MVNINSHKWITKPMVIGTSVLVLAGSMIGHAPVKAEAADNASGLTLNAASAILVDANSGQILVAKNENDLREPASTTKLMTLFLTEKAISQGKVKKTDIVPISAKAIQLEQGDSSSGWLNENEKLDLDTMLKLICVPSGNDAAEAVAEFLAGDDTQFVKEMNDEAAALGLTNTHYLDAHGLTEDPAHHTTAKDLATLARDLVVTYPDILSYTSVQSFSVNDDIRKSQNLKPFQNTNRLLGQYDGMDGLKTGFTDKAGYCLVATAKRDNMRLISVVLGAGTEQFRESDTKKLLDYGFGNYKEQTLIKKGETAPQPAVIDKGVNENIPAAAATDLSVAIKNGSPAISKNIAYSAVTAPVKAGQKVGELQIVQNGQVIAKTDLVAQSNDDKASWFRLFFRGIFKGIASVFHKVF